MSTNPYNITLLLSLVVLQDIFVLAWFLWPIQVGMSFRLADITDMAQIPNRVSTCPPNCGLSKAKLNDIN